MNESNLSNSLTIRHRHYFARRHCHRLGLSSHLLDRFTETHNRSSWLGWCKDSCNDRFDRPAKSTRHRCWPLSKVSSNIRNIPHIWKNVDLFQNSAVNCIGLIGIVPIRKSSNPTWTARIVRFCWPRQLSRCQIRWPFRRKRVNCATQTPVHIRLNVLNRIVVQYERLHLIYHIHLAWL